MNRLSQAWLQAASDDLDVIEQILSQPHLTHLFHTLDELYIESRYPGDFGLMPNGKPSVEEAKEFYEFAKTIYQQTKQKIGQ
jgi:hypothetical protein